MNFARRSRWRGAATVVLLAGAIGSAHALWQREVLLQGRAEAMSLIEAQIDSQRRARLMQGPSPVLASGPAANTELDSLVAALQRPWGAMLDALQAAATNEVSITRIQPEADAFRLRVSGQADSGQAFLEFVQRLQGDASWRAVDPLSEARQAEAGAGGKPVAFVVAVEWRQR